MQDHGSDSDDREENPDDGNAAPRLPQGAAPLHNLWQLLIGQAHIEARGPAANSNEELIAHLWRGGAIKSTAVKRAMLACPRHLFLPPDLQEEAYIDAPLRIQEHGFNVSAPHIHATALEALELTEGDSFLDVGCGCGLLAAAAAQLVGLSGSVTALDLRQAAIDMSQRSVKRLKEEDQEYCSHSCTVQWEVYVGAACPRDRLRELLQGGLLLVPVETELLLFKRLASGRLGKRCLSAVRFSELEVPRDVDVVLACMAEERREARTLAHPPSTYQSDMEALPLPSGSGNDGGGSVHGSASSIRAGGKGTRTRARTCGEGDGAKAWCDMEGDDKEAGAQGEAWELLRRPAPAQGGERAPAGSGAAAAAGEGAELVGPAAAGRSREQEGAASPKRHKSGLTRQTSYLTPELLTRLGPADCCIHGSSLSAAAAERRPLSRPQSPMPPAAGSAPAPGGSGQEGDGEAGTWKLPAHRAVLKARCEHMRALFLSGMRDAEEGALAAPEGVSASAMRCLMHHVYQDTGVEALPLEQVSEVLHVAAYFGCPHLTCLCEQRLAAVLCAPEEGADDMAAQLLALADELALTQLRQLALSYIVERYDSVSASEAYRNLPRPLVDAVAREACGHTAKVMALLRDLSSKSRPGVDSDDDTL